MTPKQVRGHQRGRLIGAMIEAVARQGYNRVTIAELVALAGVSKTAFYEQFANKEACFLAAFEEIVERGAVQIETAYRRGDGFRERMEAAFEQFDELVRAQTPAARLVFVDALSLGTAAVPARERAAARYETMMTQSFAAAPLEGEISPLLTRAIFGGLRDFAYHCLRDGEPERLGAHVSELVDWGVGYRLAAARERPGIGPRLAEAVASESATAAPAGEPVEGVSSWEEPANSPLSREVLGQRERILRASAQVAASRGYGRLSVPAISAASGTSNQTFYEFFASKEKAFLAAFDALALQAYAATGNAFAARESWLEAGAAGIKALLRFMSANPLFREIAFFELHAAGPAARERAESMLMLFVAFMQPDPVPPEVKVTPPKVVIEAIAGGLWAVVEHEITAGRGDSLPLLLPELLDLVLLPFGVE